MNDAKKIESALLDESYYMCKHKSGLDVYVYPKAMTSSYAIFATKYGSVDSRFKLEGEQDFTEVPDGIAHFLEHKLFETEEGEDTFQRYARTGASANAYTSFNLTAYLFSCTDNFYDSLEILLDFVTKPYFSDENVKKEQGIIAQEIKMYDDNPGTNLFYGLMNSLYEKNKIRTNIAGTVESISEITPEILYKCYNTFYNPSNMILSVCGNVDVERTMELVDKYIKVSESKRIIRDYPVEGPGVFCPRFEKTFSVAKPLFEIGIKDVSISPDARERAKKSLAVDILNDMLFGKSGKLFNDLYGEGLISRGLGASYEHNLSFSFNAISSESSDPEAVFGRFCEYCEDIKKNGFSKEDFERIKRVIYADIVKSFDSTEDIATNIVWQRLNDCDIFDSVDIIPTIDYEYTKNVFDNLFVPSSYALSIIRNPEE